MESQHNPQHPQPISSSSSTSSSTSNSLLDETHGSTNEEVSGEVFDGYKSQVPFGLPHPGNICESLVMASVQLPPLEYPRDALEKQISQGTLSQLQLEGILYASQAHLKTLPNGDRAGFFVGDGAGVGKGRQMAGIIAENYARGRTRHLWFSVSTDLAKDAKRDLDDIGCPGINVIDGCKALDRKKMFSNSTSNGVVFSTYATLVSESRGAGKRLTQLLEWCADAKPSNKSGEYNFHDFDGCIIFDECHKAKNVQKDESTSSKVAQCVLKLQERLPRARVVYASATGVAEVSDLAYMTRLGLWGPSTSFVNFENFSTAMVKRGLGGLEVLAMELKSSGRFVARGLSWEGAEFEVVESKLNNKDRTLYDECTEWWSDLRTDLETASDETKDKTGIKAYWGAHQRFFRGLITGLKVPFVVEQCKQALRDGHCAVIGLQSTGESALNYAAEQENWTTGGSDVGDHLSSPTFWSAIRFLEKNFPVKSIEPPSTIREREEAEADAKLSQKMTENEILRQHILRKMQQQAVGSLGHMQCQEELRGIALLTKQTSDELYQRQLAKQQIQIQQQQMQQQQYQQRDQQLQKDLQQANDQLQKYMAGEYGEVNNDVAVGLAKNVQGIKKQISIQNHHNLLQETLQHSKLSQHSSHGKSIIRIDNESDKEDEDGDSQMFNASSSSSSSSSGYNATYDDGVAAAAVDQINAEKKRQDEKEGADIPHLVELREKLRIRISDLHLPTCALDTIIDQLGGPSKVCEMTGRSRRIVRHKRTGRLSLEQRQADDGSDIVNLREKEQFMAGNRDVAIISDAASTGISLHSGLAYKNQRRRVHVTLELPWSATKAIQQLGRTHRSNQKSAPIYRLIRTDLGGEKRFVSAVAARLESLGALTRGDRRAASGADLSEFTILKSKYGITGLRKLQECLSSTVQPSLNHEDMRGNNNSSGASPGTSGTSGSVSDDTSGSSGTLNVLDMVDRITARGLSGSSGSSSSSSSFGTGSNHGLLPECIDVPAIGNEIVTASGQPGRHLDLIEIVTALRVAHQKTAITNKDFGKINVFLNRIVGIPVAYQNALFDCFASCVKAEVVVAKMRDKYDEGVPEIKAARITITEVVDVTERMRAAKVLVDRGSSHDEVIERRASVQGGAGDFYLSRHYDKSSKKRLILFASKMNDRPSFALTRPNMGRLRTEMSVSDMSMKYTLLNDADQAKIIWNAAYENSHHRDRGGRLTELLILHGEVLPYWRELESTTIQLSGQLNQMHRALRAVRCVAIDTTGNGNVSGSPFKSAGSSSSSGSGSSSGASGASGVSGSSRRQSNPYPFKESGDENSDYDEEEEEEESNLNFQHGPEITLIGIRTHPVVLGFLRAEIHARVKKEKLAYDAAVLKAKQEGLPVPPVAGAREEIARLSTACLKKMAQETKTMTSFFKRKSPSTGNEENVISTSDASGSKSAIASSTSSSSSSSTSISASAKSWRPTAAARMAMNSSTSNKKRKTTGKNRTSHQKTGSVASFFGKKNSSSKLSMPPGYKKAIKKKKVPKQKSPFFKDFPGLGGLDDDNEEMPSKKVSSGSTSGGNGETNEDVIIILDSSSDEDDDMILL